MCLQQYKPEDFDMMNNFVENMGRIVNLLALKADKIAKEMPRTLSIIIICYKALAICKHHIQADIIKMQLHFSFLLYCLIGNRGSLIYLVQSIKVFGHWYTPRVRAEAGS